MSAALMVVAIVAVVGYLVLGRINGEDYDPSTPDALDAKIQALLGTSKL